MQQAQLEVTNITLLMHFIQLDLALIVIMQMVFLLLMGPILINTSGLMQLEQQRIELLSIIVHVALDIMVIKILLQHLLGLTIIVSLGILLFAHLVFFMLMIHYGMVSSVMVWKVLVVQLTLQCLGFINHQIHTLMMILN